MYRILKIGVDVHNQAFAFIAIGDNLEQQLGRILVQRHSFYGHAGRK